MMEFIRPDLLIYFLFLALIHVTLPYLLKPLWSLVCGPDSEEIALRKEIDSLRSEQQGISIKENFASHARIQRKINKSKDDLEALYQKRLEKNLKRKYSITYGLQLILALIMLASMVYFRKVPLAIFSLDLYPFGKFLSYPIDMPGSLVPHAWVVISRVSLNTLLNSVIKMSGYVKEK